MSRSQAQWRVCTPRSPTGCYPAVLMVLGVFVSFIQTFVFILLSQLYLSEVSHAPHEHEEHGPHEDDAAEEAGALGMAVVPY